MPVIESSPQLLLSEAECLACIGSGTLWATMRLSLLAEIYQNYLHTMPDPQELAADSKCYECFGPNDYSLRLMELVMLSKILKALDPNANTDPQALLDEAACFNCFGSQSLEQLMELVMLQKINDSTQQR